MITFGCPYCRTLLRDNDIPKHLGIHGKFECPICAMPLTQFDLEVFEEVFDCPRCNEPGAVHEEKGVFRCENCGEEFSEDEIDFTSGGLHEVTMPTDENDYDIYW